MQVHTINSEFAQVATQIVSDLDEQKAALAPTLAFIDPFGWSGVPLALIRDLLSFDRCEVLFNFMFDSVNRWVADERPGIASHFNELFGSEGQEHALAAGMKGDDRKGFLSDLYMRQLRDVAGFSFVRKFEMIDVERGRTAYFLMFGTRHRKGLSVMKDAMWALDPISGMRFAGTAGAQEMLFELEPDFGPLREAIMRDSPARPYLSKRSRTSSSTRPITRPRTTRNRFSACWKKEACWSVGQIVGGGSLTRLGLGLSLNLQQAIELESNLCQTNRAGIEITVPNLWLAGSQKSGYTQPRTDPPLGLRTAACNS